MATIQQIVRDGKGSAGHSGAWRVEKDGDEFTLWHYSTEMLTWRVGVWGGTEVLYTSTGHGSVSDQNGMNQAFRVLGVPLYFSRKGGADIS